MRLSSNVRVGALISLASLLLALVLLEVTLRLFFPVTDFPLGKYEAGIGMHMAPNQAGTWIVGANAEVRGRYRINGAGWNSTHEYSSTRRGNTLRIAVIGDSYVDALQVDVDQAFPELLERILLNSPACAAYDAIEVYRFGYWGAPLSQYLSVMRHVTQRYAPDIYVITIVSGDLEESLTSRSRSSGSLLGLRQHAPGVFLTFRQNSEGEFEEVPPVPYEPSRLRRFFFTKFALPRYLYGNLRIMVAVRGMFSPNPGEPAQGQEIDEPNDASPTKSVSSRSRVMRDLVMRIFREYRSIAQQNDSRLLLMMDADRIAIYRGLEPALMLTQYDRMASEASSELGVPYINLTAAFTADFAKHGKPFNSEVDYHWNQHGHHVVGRVLADWVIDNGC